MWQVRIECLRVQTFLFAVPRLLDIIGANTLLGETLRCVLPSLAKGAGLPPDIRCPNNIPVASQDDPLTLISTDCTDLDDPASLYRNGILTRDGGHFSGLFANDQDAKTFAEKAANAIRQQLPGLRFSVSTSSEFPEKPIAPPEVVDGVAPHQSSSELTEKPADPLLQSSHFPTLPSLQICMESGRGIASKTLFYPEGKRHVSKAVLARKERGKAFRHHGGEEPPRDIASLVARAFPGGEPPQDFDELCNGHYLALIHADGNGIGVWSNGVRGDKPEEKSFQAYLDREARGERFYHAMRLAVRKAVVAAVKKVFHRPGANAEHINPYRLLMLGGDDLLFVCQAQKSLDFVLAYARALAGQPTLPASFHDNGQATRTEPLTVGVGVAIAKPNFPFYRLHEIAEELASSAKRLTRIESAPHASVVDWAVCTESWMDDIEMARASDVLTYDRGGKAEILALSGKPYFILNSAFENRPEKFPTLESLIGAAEILKAMPRSQRRTLASELRRGRRHADLCARELEFSSPPAWIAMRKAGLIDTNDIPHLWRKYGEADRYVTAYADLVEITELPHLKLGGELVQDRDADKEREEEEGG